MIYHIETNLNTEIKQAKIFQAKQFLVPPLLTVSFWFSRARLNSQLQHGIHSNMIFEIENNAMGVIL